MDSEQVICNPFQDLQATLEKEKSRSMKKLHDNSSKLRYEVKLLDLDRQKHKIEMKKRILPDRDYAYEEGQISCTERRLGANIASFYLERKMKYPTRFKSVSDISTSPMVQKARQTLKLQELTNVPHPQSSKASDRVQTAKSHSSVATSSATPVRHAINIHYRRNSHSAPLVSRSYGGQAAHAREETRLPAISDVQERKSGQVKFMFGDPLKILTSDDPLKILMTKDKDTILMTKDKDTILMTKDKDTILMTKDKDTILMTKDKDTILMTKDKDTILMTKDKDTILMTKDKDTDDSASLLSRPYTYHPGMGHERDRLHSSDFLLETSDDEDDPYLPDHIDLRALLFDREGRREIIAVKSTGQANVVPSAILRRSNAYAPKKTQDWIHQEKEQVQSKVNRFLQDLCEDRDNDSDSDSEEDIFCRGSRPPVHVPAIHQTKPSVDTTLTSTDDDATSDQSEAARGGGRIKSDKTLRIPKDAWKYIRGRSTDGSLRGTYSPEDLVLHTMTGIPLNRSLTVGIPLHSAGRAMRHTPTFRMWKVVERLIHERTKYQQHEIEELKRKMEQGMDLATAAASMAMGPGSSPPGRVPSRALPYSDAISPISQGVNG
ncbi:hypothetical protein ACOMHN_058735 [Nucella lapillus]